MAFLWLPVGLVCMALVQHSHGGEQRHPSSLLMSSGVGKNQLELAKELLRLFNLHHVIASMNVSRSAPANSGSGGSFVPSNPYWILMNHTQRRQPNPPIFVSPANRNDTNKRTGYDAKIPRAGKRNYTIEDQASRAHSMLKAHGPGKAPSSEYRRNSTAPLRAKNQTFVAPLPTEKFTLEDAPKSRPLLHTLHREMFNEKIERAKASSFPSGRMHGIKTKIRSSEIGREAAASDFKLQPAMRIITSPSSSINHEIPVSFNHAFIVLGQPAERKKALGSDYEVSVLGAVLGDLIDQSEPGDKPNKTRQYKHVFNIEGKPVIQITEVSSTHSAQAPKVNRSDVQEELKRKSAEVKLWSSLRMPIHKKVALSGMITLSHASPTAPHLHGDKKHHFEQLSGKVTTPRMGAISFGTSASELVQTTYRRNHQQHSAHFSYGRPRHESVGTLNLRSQHDAPQSQWIPLKKSYMKRDVSSKKGADSNAPNATAALSALLDDTNTIKPGKKWRGILKPRYYETLNVTMPKLLPEVIFTPDLRGTPISSISPFDESHIGSVHRVVTIYGKKTNQKPMAPVTLVVAEGSQPSLTVMQQASLVKRRHDDPDPPKQKYAHSLSDKFGERPHPPDHKDDYLLHKRAKGVRGDGEARRPPIGGGRRHSPLEPKFDPEFERSRFLKPPPLFPERDRPPHYARHPPDDHPRLRDGPPFTVYGHPEKHYGNAEPPYRPGKRPYHDRSEGIPPREDGDFEEDLDPSRFDDYEAWRRLTRPPLPASGFPPPFMPGFGGYPPFRGPSFHGGSPPFLGGPGIGTILPGKKMEKFKYLLKGGFRGTAGLRPSFFAAPQGWYCPCNYYPPAGRFITHGYPSFWSTMRGD